MWLQFPQESNEKEIMNKFKSNDYVCNFDLTKCDYNFYMKIILKRWWNSKQNPLYLYSYFYARNKCSFLNQMNGYAQSVGYVILIWQKGGNVITI